MTAYEELPQYSKPIPPHSDEKNPFEKDDDEEFVDMAFPVSGKKPSRMRMAFRVMLFLIAIFGLVACACVISVMVCINNGHTTQLSLSEWRAGNYLSHLYQIEWSVNGKDGELYKRYADGFYAGKWANKHEEHVNVAPLIVQYNGEEHGIKDIQVNANKTCSILRSDVEKNWRHSSFSYFWVHDIKTNSTKPLLENKASIAELSPDGETVAYVYNRDVYVYDIESEKSTRVTSDGGDSVFNGIPDWAYEEEVFAGDSALWWSPDGTEIAYLRTDDTAVPEFPIPYFLNGDKNKAYPVLSKLKYPKPGYANPQVELWVYPINAKHAKPSKVGIDTSLNETIITEVVWVGESLVAKLSDRQSDAQEVWSVDCSTLASKKSAVEASRVRYDSPEAVNNGWYEVTHNIIAVGAEGYVDTVDVDGYNHLAFFKTDDSDPIVLTSGEWEVLDESISVNVDTRHVYFHAEFSPSEKTLYRVSLDAPKQLEQVLNVGKGVYSAKFSGDTSYAVVVYSCPNTPAVQYMITLPADLKMMKQWTLQDNKELKALLNGRQLIGDKLKQPLVRFYNQTVGDVEVSVREILPSKFRERKKYPVVFYNYGGPGSQQVLEQFGIDFQRVLAEELDVIVVTVDPRGTGGRGRAFRDVVRDHIGDFESEDVISVAKIWADKKYVDSKKLAIWGWSYGGFLTLKTLERDVDQVFSYGVAVAPVTDWSLYDSIYTERYMHTPKLNPEGYMSSEITDVETLAKHNRFLIMHGSGDDNVHFQNTIRLLDKLDLAGIENYDMHVFPDSDHSIRFHNANVIVYDKICEFFLEHGMHGQISSNSTFHDSSVVPRSNTTVMV